MSMMGCIPVMAAPTPSPEMPASEIGESMMRAGPNSSTSPDSTLKGVPASATSSPMMNTVGSRRNSSASASRMAWPRVTSYIWPEPASPPATLSIDMFGYLADLWKRRVQTKFDSGGNLGLDFGADTL